MTGTDLASFKTMLVGNNIMRIFPNEHAVAGGKTVKVFPKWTDARFAYCRDVGAIPFVSSKVDGDPDGIEYVRGQLLALPEWVKTLYITDRHEPEGDVTPEQFKTNFTLFLAMVDSLPPALRARIRCGPVLTRTWTERTGAGRTYATYDPGTGDFFGVDMYVQSGTSAAVVSPATVPTADEFTKAFEAYQHDPGDVRDRLWAEWGLVGMPGDTDGSARADFIRACYAKAKTWGPPTTKWKFVAMIWWNAVGKATGEVPGIGQRRDFPLHQRTETATSVTTLPGSPPKPVAAYNAIFADANTPAFETPTPVPDGTPATAGEITALLKKIAGLIDEITVLVAGK